MTGYVFVTSSGTSQSTYIHIFHLLLWCAASSELAPQSSSSSNQYHLNSYHPRITVEKNTQKAELKMSHRKSYFTWTRKEGQPLHISRSKATLLPIWTKVTTQRASRHPPPTWSNQWLHMKKLQPAMAAYIPTLRKATPHVLQVQEHVPAFDAFRKSAAPTCHVFGTTDESNQQNEHSEISSTAFQKRNQ